MANIQILDQSTINKIAAGEVIDRPASIVKELLENAIDAGSTAVTVEIKEGGISFIRITDNGCGIVKEDIALAFLRHSTSKIRSAEDLASISSLGFRGEALSSIAAVAQVELITKTRDALNGCRYIIEGGREIKLEEVGVPEGTTFLVKNLFYNTPARKKFLKSAQTEAGYIGDLVEKISLSHPEVSIRFMNNQQNKLHTSGNHNVKDIIYHIYGREIARNLLELNCEAAFGSVSGYLGKPMIARGNRAHENYFINGRYVKSTLITKAIEEAYQPFLMQHKYPFTVLHLKINPELIDVNVHPSKMELKFQNEKEIYEFLTVTIREGLLQRELIPEISFKQNSKSNENALAEKKESRPVRMPEPFEEMRQKREEREQRENLPIKYKAEATERKRDKLCETEGYQINTSQDKNSPKKEEKRDSSQMELFDDKLLSKTARSKHRIIGQIFDTYWLVEYQEKLFFIDQHAAHEKVLYERIIASLRTKEYTSQLLHPPVILTLNLKEETILKQYQEYFQQIGFEIEHFGGKEYAVRAIPDNLFGIAKPEFVLEIIDQLEEQPQKGQAEQILDRVATMSCKAAVKGNRKMTFTEAEILIDQLLGLENPYNCPHGRPTIISMSKKEMEQKFKRIV